MSRCPSMRAAPPISRTSAGFEGLPVRGRHHHHELARDCRDQRTSGCQYPPGGGADHLVTLSALANLVPSVELLFDIVRNPAFAQSEIDRARSQRITRSSRNCALRQRLPRAISPTSMAPKASCADLTAGTASAASGGSRAKTSPASRIAGSAPTTAAVFVCSTARWPRSKQRRTACWRLAVSVSPRVPRASTPRPQRPPKAASCWSTGSIRRRAKTQRRAELQPFVDPREIYVDFLNANNALGGTARVET